jgi:hypothetical protein
LPKKQLGSFLSSHLRGEDFVWSNRYPSYYSPSFLNKRFKSNVNATNNYDLFFRGARQLVDKQVGTSSIIHLGSKQRRLHGQYVDNAIYMNMFDVLAMRIVGDRFQDKAKFTNFFGKREPTLYYKGGHYGVE